MKIFRDSTYRMELNEQEFTTLFSVVKRFKEQRNSGMDSDDMWLEGIFVVMKEMHK